MTMEQAMALLSEQRRELESLRDWKQTITGAPKGVKAVCVERFKESMQMKPFIDEWRRKVAALEMENASLKSEISRLNSELAYYEAPF